LQSLFKKNYTKIGILGGTFDPPHKGHLYISKIVLKKLKLNKLIWIVTKKNPLKQKPYLSIKTRINLSKEITKKEKKIFVRYLDDKIKSNNTNGIFTKFQKDKKITKWDKFLCSVGWHRYIKYHIKGKHNMIYSKERCRKCGREPLTLI